MKKSGYEDLIAQHIAEKGVTKVPMDARTMTDRQMKRAIGYEPEKLTIFWVTMTGEDGMEFTESLSAENEELAYQKAMESWPESRIDWIRPKGTDTFRSI